MYKEMLITLVEPILKCLVVVMTVGIAMMFFGAL